jgi:hypothetical protein
MGHIEIVFRALTQYIIVDFFVQKGGAEHASLMTMDMFHLS